MFPIEQLIDDRNRTLYENIAKAVPIEIQPSDDEYWGAILKDGVARISCAPSEYPYSCFAHELLHIQMDLRGMGRPGRIIEAASQADFVAIEPMVDDFLCYAYNQLIHHKMFPDFSRLGFPATEFLHEADDNEGRKRVAHDIATLKKRRKAFTHGIPARLYIFPYLYARSPHDTSPDAQRMIKDIRNLADGSYYGVHGLVNKWCEDPEPDVRKYVAQLFSACGYPDVGFGPDESDLVWARDCKLT